jgi:hypothetical protein
MTLSSSIHTFDTFNIISDKVIFLDPKRHGEKMTLSWMKQCRALKNSTEMMALRAARVITFQHWYIYISIHINMVFGITMPPNLWVNNDSHLIWCDLRSQHKTDTGREAQDTADHDHLLDGADAQTSDISDIFSGQE